MDCLSNKCSSGMLDVGGAEVWQDAPVDEYENNENREKSCPKQPEETQSNFYPKRSCLVILVLFMVQRCNTMESEYL